MSYIGRQPFFSGNLKLDRPAFDGSTLSFSLTSGGVVVSPGIASAVIISIDGVIQEPGTAYYISGSTITFTEAIPGTASFFGFTIGYAMSIPNSVPLSGGTMQGYLSVPAGATGSQVPRASEVVPITGNSTITGNITVGGTFSVSGAVTISAINGTTIPTSKTLADIDSTQTLTNKTLTTPVISKAVTLIASPVTAVKSGVYVFTGSTTLTLPASPATGDTVSVVNRSGTTTPIVARNGQNIMGLGQDLTLDKDGSSFTLVYTDSSNGWVISL